MGEEAPADSEDEGVEEAPEKEPEISSARRGYPYVPVLFLLAVTVGQGYVSAGLQAVLELYFVRFLYVCSGDKRATSLGTTSVNVYIAIYQVSAISAGFLADKIFGNYLTQTCSVFLTSAGIFLLSLATWQYSIAEPHCCYDNIGSASSLLQNWSSNCTELHKEIILGGASFHMSSALLITIALLGLLLYSVGYGHINTLQSVFVADQFQEDQSDGKRRSFSWFYLCCNLGALGGESGLPLLRQSLGFVVAWLTLLGSTVLSTFAFLLGSCFYVKKRPKVNCCRRKSNSTSLNVTKKDEKAPLLSKKTSHVSKEVVSWLQLVPFLGVFGPLVVFWGVFYQQNTTWVVQGTHMDCYLGKLHVPPDLMPSINDFLVVVIIPVMEYLVYPHLERTMKIKILALHKLVIGMVSAALSFLLSGLLEVYVARYPGSDCRGEVSIAWQLPQIGLISVAEAIVCTTGLEFAYSQAPAQYRNVTTSMWYISQALGTLLNAGVAQIPKLSLLEEYFLYTALLLAVTAVFAVINRRFRYKDASDDKIS